MSVRSSSLAGRASQALRAMMAEREAEKTRLEAQGGAATLAKPAAILLPHPMPVERFRSKVAALRTSLGDPTVRSEAAAVLSTQIESVTIYPDKPNGPEGRGRSVHVRLDVVCGKRKQPPSWWRRGLFYKDGCGDRI